MVTVFLKKGREKSVRRHHPWIFSGSVGEIAGTPEEGETVRLVDAAGKFIAWGAISTRSRIRVRVWSWEEEEEIGEQFFRERLRIAISMRQNLISSGDTNALRLIHGESDGIPGLIVDQYDDTLVLQCLSSGAEYWRNLIADLLVELCDLKQLYERSDVEVRNLEGLPLRSGVMRGNEPSENIQIHEGKNKFLVDIRRGQKTGFYLDQRNNRLRFSGFAAGKEVLDCFAYTGGFTVNALAGGAISVISVDSSEETIQLGKKNLELNGYSKNQVEWVQGNAFHLLREFRDKDASFDLIVLDPPKFAPTASHASRAARGYKDINLLAFKLLRPGGWLFTFSCSGGVSADLFQKIVSGAALDAGVDAQIIEYLNQAPDHPVALSFPEGAYLKGLLVHKRA